MEEKDSSKNSKEDEIAGGLDDPDFTDPEEEMNQSQIVAKKAQAPGQNDDEEYVEEETVEIKIAKMSVS